jgi:predicted MFS family arabinose efflux permease
VSGLPLQRNRDFLLLQAGQLLSHGGTQLTAIAYPLLVLDVTGSAAKAGVVAAARMAALALLALPAGLAADHWQRKRLMIAADVVRVVALASLGIAIALDGAAFWAIALVAFVEGCGAALFSAAHPGALRAVVPPTQLPAATSVQVGRQAAMNLAGPPLGGALFGVARALPFVIDAFSYAFSTVSLLLMRTPFEEQRERDTSSLRSRVAEGFRFLWSQPFLRTCALLFGLANFIGPGLILAVVVLGERQGLSGGEIGLLLASFGACVLLGSFLSPLVRRLLPIRGVLVLELWTWPGCALFLVWPNVYVLMAGLLPSALVIPSTDSVVHGYRIAMTPDRLLGRSESARTLIALVVAPLGPIVAGALLGAVSARATIALFAASALVLALWGTFSPSIRAAPRLEELAAVSQPAPGLGT